jgi:hypothetical protein
VVRQLQHTQHNITGSYPMSVELYNEKILEDGHSLDANAHD